MCSLTQCGVFIIKRRHRHIEQEQKQKQKNKIQNTKKKFVQQLAASNGNFHCIHIEHELVVNVDGFNELSEIKRLRLRLVHNRLSD